MSFRTLSGTSLYFHETLYYLKSCDRYFISDEKKTTTENNLLQLKIKYMYVYSVDCVQSPSNIGKTRNLNFFCQDHFERLSSTKTKQVNKKESIPVGKIIKRHAGVLGLCAYVQAYPYDVPELMPQILMDLSSHVNDPQPIQV